MICEIFRVERRKREINLALAKIDKDKTFATTIELGQPIHQLWG
jgi:hypothetical protein